MIETPSKYLLQKYWNYDEFIYPQEEIIQSVLDNQDTLALLPTGGGKSLCYQLPALIKEGITLVISPLMALIKDQIKELNEKGIKAMYLSSEQGYLNQVDIFDHVRSEGYKILYVSPERLQNYMFQSSISNIDIDLIAVDEAHCISEWGNDFRPSYLAIKNFREQLGNPTTIALTASATPQIQEDIINKLGLEEVQIFKKSFARDNLNLRHIQSENKFYEIKQALQKHRGSSIIYVRRRKEAENLAKQLKDEGFSADYFHAGLPEKEKNARQSYWIQSNHHILVATNAFGMGINKSNVRLIIHYNLPYSIENYYQEIGRAGRDGELSYCYLLYNEFDIQENFSEFKTFYLNESEYDTIIHRLIDTWFWVPNSLPEESIDFDIHDFLSKTKFQKNKVTTALQYLNNQDIITWIPRPGRSVIRFNIRPQTLDYIKGYEQLMIEALSRRLPGVFQNKVKFNEKSWARQFDLSTTEFNQYLKKWKNEAWIEYEDGNLQKVYFRTPRNDNQIFGPLKRNFRVHQKKKLEKLKNLFFLAKQNEECRMKLLLRYFGEKTHEDCGNCDICEKKFNALQEGLESSILSYISKKECTLAQIMFEYNTYEDHEILEALQFLLSEGKIRNLNFNTYQIKSK